MALSIVCTDVVLFVRRGYKDFQQETSVACYILVVECVLLVIVTHPRIIVVVVPQTQ